MHLTASGTLVFYTKLEMSLLLLSFLVREYGEHKTPYPTRAGVPQGSVAAPEIHLLYTVALPTWHNVTVDPYADDIIILIQKMLLIYCQLILIEYCSGFRSIKSNTNKFVQVTFTHPKDTYPPVLLNNQQLWQQDNTRYLGTYLDRWLTWKKYIFTRSN